MSQALNQEQDLKAEFIASTNQIRREYTARIQQLKAHLRSCCLRLQSVEKELAQKDNDLINVTSQRDKLQSEVERLHALNIRLETANQGLRYTSQDKIAAKDKQIQELRQSLGRLEEQLSGFKNMECISLDQSSVYNQEYSRQQFSFQISEIFKNSPGEMLKFLDSIEGESSGDPKELGDMTCMFVSKDGLSLQKYININRTFLKRKIKEHQPRFRFVLIYKPDAHSMGLS